LGQEDGRVIAFANVAQHFSLKLDLKSHEKFNPEHHEHVARGIERARI